MCIGETIWLDWNGKRSHSPFAWLWPVLMNGLRAKIGQKTESTQWRFTHNLRPEEKRTGIIKQTFCVWVNLFIFVANFICKANKGTWCELNENSMEMNRVTFVGSAIVWYDAELKKLFLFPGTKQMIQKIAFCIYFLHFPVECVALQITIRTSTENHILSFGAKMKRKWKLFNRLFSLLYGARSMNSIGFIIWRRTTIQAKS